MYTVISIVSFIALYSDMDRVRSIVSYLVSYIVSCIVVFRAH